MPTWRVLEVVDDFATPAPTPILVVNETGWRGKPNLAVTSAPAGHLGLPATSPRCLEANPVRSLLAGIR